MQLPAITAKKISLASNGSLLEESPFTVGQLRRAHFYTLL
jgi:hypothetical protein